MPSYQFSLRAILPYFDQLPDALVNTILLSALTIFISSLVGLAGALMRTNPNRWIRVLGTAYVEVMRNVPLVVLLYLVYFGLPEIGWRLDGFSSALLALTLNSGAYMTEIFRGGLLAIPRGQYEAARSQAMSGLQVFRYVIFPQVFRIIYAPLGNQLIAVVLGSSLASVVAVPELTSWMGTTGSASFRYFETFVVAGFLYVILCQIINLARIVTGHLLFRSSRGGGRP
jgi:His/Glu/Gln/Arg/opine family amino acid ABC transporter permease subunit